MFGDCLDAVRETTGPVIADFAPRDLYRLTTFLRIAQETGLSCGWSGRCGRRF